MKRFYAIVLVLCLLLSGCHMRFTHRDEIPPVSRDLEVHYVDVGQADCIFLRCDGKTMLIDGGNVEDSNLVVSYLLSQSVTKLDYVVNTHAHEDHVGGLPGVMAVFEVGAVWCPVTEYSSSCFEDFANYADQQYLELTLPEPGSTYELGQAQVTVLGPVKEYDDTNDTSIVLRVDHGDNSFLFTGDAEETSEKDILDYGMDVSATVLKLGHHGSDTSTCYQWLRAVAPEYAVIQVGEGNTYGHPHEVVMSRLRDADVQVFRTDLQGHIVCRSDGEGVTFTTNKNAPVTNPTQKTENLIGNKNSGKFHLPECSGLPKEENRVFFASYEEATAAGYAPCGNCLG
ncbi:MAG: MBL fold metallo-hydrolase [Oscillospiraceae bacterium]|nr:MBL fold metallo-hydrolase [Oscillospiraceae bacterium]